MSKNKNTKLSYEDLEAVVSLNREKMELNDYFVRLGWAEVDLEIGKKRASENALKISETEDKLNRDLIEKYGMFKNLNLETGEFEIIEENTPNKDSE